MSNLLSQSHIQSYFPLFICLGTPALWNYTTCHCHTIHAERTEPFSPNPFQFWRNVAQLPHSEEKLQWQAANNMTAAWNGIWCVFRQWHSDLIGVSNHVGKGHRGVWVQRTIISPKTCVSDMLPKSLFKLLKVYSTHSCCYCCIWSVCVRGVKV